MLWEVLSKISKYPSLILPCKTFQEAVETFAGGVEEYSSKQLRSFFNLLLLLCWRESLDWRIKFHDRLIFDDAATS